MEKEKCTIKLNHNCKYCKEAIYIDQDPITGKRGPCHLDCLLKKRDEQWIETCEILCNSEIMTGLKEAMNDFKDGKFTVLEK